MFTLTDGYILASRHRNCTRHHAGNGGHEYIRRSSGSGRYTNDQARRRDDTVICAKNRGAKPADARDKMVFYVQSLNENSQFRIETIQDSKRPHPERLLRS